MSGRGLVVLALLATGSVAGAQGPREAVSRPNIVYILADDLGYGDVSCLNPESKIRTPHVDRLAGEGITFTDAHSGSAVCTPTRYGVLTGRYAWRTRLKQGVLYGYSGPLIAPGRLTVPALLKQHGYHTAAFGKWHLGMHWTLKGEQTPPGSREEAPPAQVDYTARIHQAPTSVGFDEFYGISASLDMPPYIWIRNDRTEGVPTTEKTYIRKGPAHADFEAEHVLPTLGRKSAGYIEARAKDRQPFFLYLPLNSPHTPIAPSEKYAGRSGLNPYADFTLQTDAVVGQVLEALERTGQAKNTLVVFTSDNGCSPQADYPTLLAKGHNPSHVFRGHKADIYEGGHRVPFIARWPARVKAGTKSAETVCLTDLMATCAEIVGAKLPPTAGEDSVSLLPALVGTTKTPLREATVHHSINGSFAIRQGKWKLALCPGSGGWSAPRPGRDDTSKLPNVQLYDLSQDLGEQKNLQAEQPEVVGKLTRLLQSYADRGRSTPGPTQPNDSPVDIYLGQKRN